MISKCLYRFDEFELDQLRRTLLRDGRPVPISPKAFEILLCLLQHAGEVVTKEQLLKTVWPASFVEEDNLVQHISALRKAFTGRTGYIVTVPGRGYQFAAPVEVVSPPATVPDSGARVLQRERMSMVIEESVELPGPAAQSRLAATMERISSRSMRGA